MSRYELPTYSSNPRQREPVGSPFRQRLQQDEYAAAAQHQRIACAVATGPGKQSSGAATGSDGATDLAECTNHTTAGLDTCPAAHSGNSGDDARSGAAR